MDSLAETQDLRSHDRARERRCGMREMYIERTIEIINQLDNERLKKVYTVAKTLLRFLKENGGA